MQASSQAPAFHGVQPDSDSEHDERAVEFVVNSPAWSVAEVLIHQQTVRRHSVPTQIAAKCMQGDTQIKRGMTYLSSTIAKYSFVHYDRSQVLPNTSNASFTVTRVRGVLFTTKSCPIRETHDIRHSGRTDNVQKCQTLSPKKFLPWIAADTDPW